LAAPAKSKKTLTAAGLGLSNPVGPGIDAAELVDSVNASLQLGVKNGGNQRDA
jgi:hypothetical protein